MPTGYSTFKPTRLVAASEVVAKTEPGKEEESTGKGNGSDGLKSERVKAEENAGKGSSSDRETPPQGTQL